MPRYRYVPQGGVESLFGKNTTDDLQELYEAWKNSPELSTKNTDFFPTYSSLLSKYRNKRCTVVEIGVLDGGSLFMWRKWLGKEARIVGIDLNPQAKKWESAGFEIKIGDQADQNFLNSVFEQLGEYDILIDDGGHLLHQQIVTVITALNNLKREANIIIEDTHTSFMKSFQSNHQPTFLDFVKDITDILIARQVLNIQDDDSLRTEFPEQINKAAINTFSSVESIQFFPGIVCLHCNPERRNLGLLVRNKQEVVKNVDFRYQGLKGINVDWPYAFKEAKKAIKVE
tara:strand:+ start:210 stop:1067 length:858 start_codon:yes stop_codon:yes gene_type:complete